LENYFEHIMKSLTIEDVGILHILLEEDATAKVKSLRNVSLYERSQTTEAKYRKILNRLIATSFIETNTDYKEHSIFITEFGINAFEQTLENMKGSGQL
jgi:predicted MarR family transcription regulator